MLLSNIQEALQSKETLQDLLRSDESSNANCEEISNLRYIKRRDATYNQTLTAHSLESGQRECNIIHLGYQPGCCLRLHRSQLVVFYTVGAIEYIYWYQ